MKQIFTLLLLSAIAAPVFSQTDTLQKNTPKKDTIRVGGMVIIRDSNKKNEETTKDGSKKTNETDNTDITISIKDRAKSIKVGKDKPSKVKTNWFIIDLGFSNYDDKTDYIAAQAQNLVSSEIKDAKSLKLNTGKSINVNLWLFMQKVGIIKNVVNLKYGLGWEMNNYKFSDKSVRFYENPTKIDMSYSGLSKNKLYTGYLTVPMMLNFNLTPKKGGKFAFSAGASAGYLTNARQKTKIDGKVNKLRDDFDLDKWKISYQGELRLGPVMLYGTLATKSMFDNALDITPYTVGIRLGKL